MKVSVVKPVWVWPTERHQSTGTPVFMVCSETCRLAMA